MLTIPEGVVIDVSLEALEGTLYIVTLEDKVVYGKWLYIQQHVLPPGGTHIYRATCSYFILEMVTWARAGGGAVGIFLELYLHPPPRLFGNGWVG